MMRNVSLCSLLPAESFVSILNRATGETTVLCIRRGMLSVAGQVLRSQSSAVLAELEGYEVVYTAGGADTRLEVNRRTRLGTQQVCALTVVGLLQKPTHYDSMFTVTGLSALGTHILSRRHSFSSQSVRPLQVPLCGDEQACVARVREMELVVSETDAGDKALLQTLGSVQPLAAPQPERLCTYSGAEVYKSFFMFNSSMVSRLTSLYPGQPLACARGVCVNMAVAHRMLADAGSLVYAETLMAGPIDGEDMAALTALRQTAPCCCVQYRRRDGPKQTVLVYAVAGQCAKLAPSYVMFSEHGTPIVVGVREQTPLASGLATYSPYRAAVRNMLFLHAASDPALPLHSCRHALKNACFAQHAGAVSDPERAQLYAMSRDDSPLIYSMACEFGEC